jgi:hypothetical protein
MVCIDNTYTVVVATNKGQIKGYQIERLPGKMDGNRGLNSSHLSAQSVQP